MKVDRCVCIKLSFEQLKAMSDRDGLSYEQLCAQTRCCSACKMCEPYIRKMFETGETAFILDRKNPAPVAGITRVMSVRAARPEGDPAS